jgi:hypothetical protein
MAPSGACPTLRAGMGALSLRHVPAAGSGLSTFATVKDDARLIGIRERCGGPAAGGEPDGDA